METFKLKVNKTTEEEVEVKLPLFRKKDHIFFYKVFSKEECLSVFNNTGSTGGWINVSSASLAFHLDDVVDCTEEEFLEGYRIVSEKLEKLTNPITQINNL